MNRIQDLVKYLDRVFPVELAADWDNTGLLIGDREREVVRVMTCLTVSPDVVGEAVQERADLIVSHHPFPFRAARRWTSDTPVGKMLLDLVASHIAVYSPHTAHDSALCGINEQIAHRLELQEIECLYPGTVEASEDMLQGGDFRERGFSWQDKQLGTGRIGRLARRLSVNDFVLKVREIFGQQVVQAAFPEGQMIETVAIGCGAADDFVLQASAVGADVLLAGEARFHTFLDAVERGLALVAPGHYATERFAMEILAGRISDVFPSLLVWPSRVEADPVRYFV